MAYSNPPPQPIVFIIGAGLSGLLLAALLEKTHIPYRVFERAQKVKPLGSALSLGPSILRALDQLGLMEELNKISMPCEGVALLDINLNKIGDVKGSKNDKEMYCEPRENLDFLNTGYRSIVLTRPDFYKLLLRQVPAENISFGKKVLKVTEEDGKATIHLSDNTAYECDILIGADGTYSAVRQNMYRTMEEKGVLPRADGESIPAGYTVSVGVSAPLSREKYPQVKNDDTHFEAIFGGDCHTWNIMMTTERRACWTLCVQFASQQESKRQIFRNSEWSADQLNPMLKEFRDFPCPYGGTMGEIIDLTPPELISRVFLECKMFKTWFHGRSVLIGDSCHKMLPSTGEGAANAMQDSVILANCLYDLEDLSEKSITAAFQSYYDQRFRHAKAAYDMSKRVAKVTMGQNLSERILRSIVFNLPESIQKRSQPKPSQNRPIATFLSEVPIQDTGDAFPQPPSKRYQWEQQQRRIEEKKKKEKKVNNEVKSGEEGVVSV